MEGFTRLDGRTYSELRPIDVQLNPLKSGPSCRINVGDCSGDCGGSGSSTSVIAVVFFSHDNKNRNGIGSFHKPTFEVYVRPAAGPVKGHIRGMECVLLKTLQRLVYSENLGKTLVSMRLQVLEDGGGLLSVCMNAMITCALLAGLKLQEIPHAVSFGLVNRNGSPGFLLDPTDEELKAYCTGGVTLLSDPNTGGVSLTTIDTGVGGIDRSILTPMYDIAQRTAHIRVKQIEEEYKRAFDAARVSFEANII